MSDTFPENFMLYHARGWKLLAPHSHALPQSYQQQMAGKGWLSKLRHESGFFARCSLSSGGSHFIIPETAETIETMAELTPVIHNFLSFRRVNDFPAHISDEQVYVAYIEYQKQQSERERQRTLRLEQASPASTYLFHKWCHSIPLDPNPKKLSMC
jgi:hypothetical protein